MPKLKLRKRTLVEQIKKTSKEKIKPKIKEPINPDNLIPTSSTLLNCACSDCPTGGYGIGKLVNLIGDSSSGKTLLGLSCFAEMAMFKKFDEYAFIYDDVEAALEFNLDHLFSEDVSKRIDMSITSDTIQDFSDNIAKAIKDERPFVYILDSLDALTSIEERERFYSERDKRKKEGWKTEKVKVLTQILRVIARDIKKIEATVIIISQTRDNLGWGFSTKTRSGGRALKFYSCHEMWLSIIKEITKSDETIGVNIKSKVSKNKLTGKKRKVEFPIYDDYGVDNIGSSIDFLIKKGRWAKKGLIIHAPEFSLKGTREKIISRIETNLLENDLQLLVGEVWNSKEKKLELNRKPKYG